MAARVARTRALLRRFRDDRRLPPPVAALLTDLVRLRSRALAEQVMAAALPPIGRSGHVAVTSSTARLDGRRLRAIEPGALSFADLAHGAAGRSCAALESAGITVFVADRHGESLVLGIDDSDRSAVLRVLREAFDEPGWFVEWHVGSGRRVTALDGRRADRLARVARSWRVFRALDWAGRVVGAESAVELTFWAPGTSGQVELIGTRGNARYDARSPRTVEVIDGRSYPGNAAFPVATALEYLDQPVDVVVTWVDGDDPAWRESFEQWARREGRVLTDVGLDRARYQTRDELRYCLRSIWAYCGWVRSIYLVTSGQTPPWLVPGDRLTVVTHSQILPDDALPTFNSHSIEAALHRIEGLAEHFIYFNDDMFVARAARPELFFTPNGLARVFSSSARVPGYEDGDTLAVDTAARRGRELLEERFGRVVTYKPHHSPYPLRRSVMFEIEDEFSEIMKRTQRSRFRAPSDLSTAASFGQHYALATGRAVFSDISTDYVHVESARLAWHLKRLSLSRSFDTFCINETRHGSGVAGREALIARFLDSTFPVAAPWER